MRRLLALLSLLAAATTSTAHADDVAGRFDYYVLSLTWTPTWCALEGDARGSPQCEAGRGYGFTLHGLWPQYETGWPAGCRTSARAPTRGETGAMTDIMGSSGLAFHEWRVHGTCSGLDAGDYFAAARAAYASVMRPKAIRALDREVTLPAQVVEAAFLEANPGLTADGVTVTCKAGRVQEVRICLTKALAPRAYGADVVRDCALRDALLSPMR